MSREDLERAADGVGLSKSQKMLNVLSWAILAAGFAAIIGLGVLVGGHLGFFVSAIAGGIFALVLNAWYQWRHPV